MSLAAVQSEFDRLKRALTDVLCIIDDAEPAPTPKCLMCNKDYTTLPPLTKIQARCGHTGVGIQCAWRLVYDGCEISCQLNDCWACRNNK